MASARNKTFHPDHEPLRNRSDLQLNNDKIVGPFSFLNPTQAHYDHVVSNTSSADSGTSGEDGEAVAKQDVQASQVGFKWTSRNNRKGRHALVIKSPDAAGAQYATPALTNGAKEVFKTIGKMFTYFPIWDVSYDVAFIFTIGSVIWVINAFFALLPFTTPRDDFSGETLYGGGITAFIGATVFEIGSVLLMLEAVNENRAGCFGWAVEQAYKEHFSHADSEGAVTRVTPAGCTHHHQNNKNFVGNPASDASDTVNEKTPTVSDDPTPPGNKSWVWWPSWYELRTHYLRDIGFIACSWQMFGATVFWISGFTALPGIYNHLSPVSVLNGVYWVPQVVGGTGFVISGTFFMLETQKHWWQPAFNVLGWHIGLWNLIGGIGFTLCPIFGFSTAHWREYQASCSTFWGK